MEEKVLQITFFAIVYKKTFMIQAILYIKIPAKIKSARKHSRMLPDSRNLQTFSSANNSHYTVAKLWNKLLEHLLTINELREGLFKEYVHVQHNYYDNNNNYVPNTMMTYNYK